MWSGRRNILCIRLAVAAKSARGGHALFKAYETAIRSAAGRSLAVKCAPRIVLGFGTCSNADDTDANSQHEQQEPHSRLLGWPLSYTSLLSRFIPYPRDTDIVPAPDLTLEFGDRVGVLMPPDRKAVVRQFFGDSVKAAAEFSYVSLGIGMVLGVLIGLIPIPIPGV